MAKEKLTEQIKIRVYPGMKRALKRLAAERDRKDSELARQAIENLLAAARDKKAA
jgi:predicted transcriptional regulator